MRFTFKYRLYPTRAQAKLLDSQLREACDLYNAGLQERRDAWRLNHKSINYYDQANQLKEIRAMGDLDLANFSVCQDVLRRVDKTFKAFFRRIKAQDEKAGFPRFKSYHRFNSMTFPNYGDGCRLLDDGKLRVQGIGRIKVKLCRAVDGRIKTATIKRECDKWYVCFSVEREMRPLPETEASVGIDVGLTHFATLSDGSEIENPRWYRQAQTRLRVAQRRVARREKGSHRRRKAVQFLRLAHAHVRNQRSDFHHKVSERVVANFGTIVVEDLNLKGLASGMLSKSVHDAGWGMFIKKIAYKAESAGRNFFRVNPSGTTQQCSGCGRSVPKSLGQRMHSCSCGLQLGRDHNAAINIQRLGLSLQGITCPA